MDKAGATSCYRWFVDRPMPSLTKETGYNSTGGSYHNGRCPDRGRHIRVLGQVKSNDCAEASFLIKVLYPGGEVGC